MGAGGRKHYDLSARDFKAPLLRVLGDLSDGTAEWPVRFKDTWSPICHMMGITLDQYGTVENNKTQVQVWIGWAFRHLKSEGLGIGKGRGKWSLTDVGVEAYKALPDFDGPPVPVTAVASKDDDSAPAPPTPQEIKLPPTVGLTFNVGPGRPDADYHPDPYIRALAVRNTACFGCFTPRSNVCGNCLLSGACQNLVAAEMSALASLLAKEDEEAALAEVAAKAQPAMAKKVAEPETKTKAKTKAKTFDNEGAESLVAHVESTCCRCGETIAKGANCYWIRNQGDRKGGLFHEECY